MKNAGALGEVVHNRGWKSPRDGTRVPMRKEELAGRAGKQADGSAKTRLAYLGCVFTQHQTDEDGHLVRDYESTTYVSSFGSIEEFGPSLGGGFDFSDLFA